MEICLFSEEIKKPKLSIKSFSNGLTFRTIAIVKKIPCDQLDPLKTRKDRRKQNKERRNWVVRKLHRIGGWIRERRNKGLQKRVFVYPNTVVPKDFRQRDKSKRVKCENSEWNFLDV